MYENPSMPPPDRRPRRGAAAAAGAVVGVAAGVAIAWAASANASGTSGVGRTTQPLAANYAVPPAYDIQRAAPHGGPGNCPGLGTTGTVTAIGAHSVTIKTSSGTHTYAVTSASDIDKNGEATLGDLKVGDAVRFDTQSVHGKALIDHLHAGDEAKDRPNFPPQR